MTEDFPAIFVINLAQDEKRRTALRERLERLGRPYRFVAAVNGLALDPAKTPNYDARRRKRYFGRDLTAGEVGCLMSHRKVCEIIEQENLPVALVLEDGAVF